MSLRAADLRFLLPAPPRTAAVAPSRDELLEALTRLRVKIVDPVGQDHAPDLLVAARSARLNPESVQARSVVVGGWPADPLGWQRRERTVHRYLATSGPNGPALVALATGPVRNYLATQFSRPSSPLGRIRNRIVSCPLGGLAANLVVASVEPGLPYPIAAALPPGVAATVTGWLLSFRQGDDLQRVVAIVFCHDRSSPSFVVKFGRVPGVPGRAAAERAALDAVARAGPDVARRATAIEHRGVLDASELTVEPAAPGSTLTAYLQRAPVDRALAVADSILEWLRVLGRRTARPNRATAAVRPGEFPLQDVDRLAGLPVVVAHQDLGSWNILTDGISFTVVDWESATTSGLPLADVFYFCTDVLAELHGPRDTRARPAWCVELWTGSLPASALLRRWVLEAAGPAGVTDRQVGALATACWLHHGQSQDRRAAALRDGPAGYCYLGRISPIWVADSRLGLEWSGFSTWARS